jgi:hypothetical protein
MKLRRKLKVVKRRKKNKPLMWRKSLQPPNMHMGNLVFRQPLNPDWTTKVSYKGKTYLMREKKKGNLRLVEKEVELDYRFHMAFQQDFYESVIISKNKPVALSQWID